MQEINDLSNHQLSLEILEKVKNEATKYKEIHHDLPTIMEVCGSHTMALARTGIKKALHQHVRLVSGPGCPVCVTDQKSIDAMIKLAEVPNLVICTFGDMMRVPGTQQTLINAKTEGKDVRVLYSPIEAVEIANNNPTKEVVFLGIGFETTIPTLVAAIEKAEQEQVSNFSIWFTTKLVEPILKALLQSNKIRIDGFLLPGHVSVVIGANSYHYLVDEYRISGVISGFEALDMLTSIYKLLFLLLNETPRIENNYRRVVTNSGNKTALNLMEKYLYSTDEAWRGIGVIEKSGLDLRERYSHYNAKKKFQIQVEEPRKTKCRCGEILQGIVGPKECSLFNKACTPIHPVGPCMVSSEGTCAAYYQYMKEDL